VAVVAAQQQRWTLLALISVAQFMVILDYSQRLSTAS
jgi:hypothetical protein